MPAGNVPADDHELRSKDVFTTGEAAKVCQVSQQTIIRCFDAGRISGFRVPGSRFRRIPRADLIRFMRENSIPLANLEGAARAVCVIGAGGAIIDALRAALRPADEFRVLHAADAFTAGAHFAEARPELVVIDDAVVGLEPSAVLAFADRSGRTEASFIVLGRDPRGERPGPRAGVVRMRAGASPEEVAAEAVRLLAPRREPG